MEAQNPRPSLYTLIPSLFGVKTADIIDFSRQLAAFLESGSSLHTALELLIEQNTKPALQALISDLQSRIEQGASFSEAVKAHSDIFPHSYWEVIQSCEKTGELEKGLTQIAGYMENRAVIADKIRRALAYPIFVICLALGVTVLLLTTVLPSIIKLFDSYQTDLPPVTVIVLGIVNFVMLYKFYILGTLLGVILAVIATYKNRAGKAFIDQTLLRLPVIGTIIIYHNLGMFCRSASMLLKAGLPLPNIMEVSLRSASGNHTIQKSLTQLKNRLLQGEGLAVPMSQDKLFPNMMVKMIKIGEHTGTLDASMKTLADYYQDQSNKRISTLVAMIEPGLTILIGIGIAILMVSMIVPIYKIMGSMQ
jgi:type IV pilus assembly protein PilC